VDDHVDNLGSAIIAAMGTDDGRRVRPVALTWVLLAMVATVLLGACGKSGSAAVTSVPDAAGTTFPPTGSGCGSAAAGTTTLMLSVTGDTRTVIVHVPRGYTGNTKVPLVLNMHGSGSTAAEQEALTGMDATADEDGFIVAYPQALIPDGTGFDWNVPGEPLVGGRPVPANAPNDVDFLTQLVGTLAHRYCIDPHRVFATGFSGGARTASQLACDSSTTFAAVAPVSGLRRPTPCPATRAVPVIAFHGTADPVDPYNGNGQSYWTYSVPQAAADWLVQDGCSPTPATTQPDPGVSLTAFGGCRNGASVELYTISGEGHEWPGGPHLRRAITRLLGPQSTAIDANAVMWAFFEAHPMS
jgi:polyhydroxybutyrate depolymerase